MAQSSYLLGCNIQKMRVFGTSVGLYPVRSNLGEDCAGDRYRTAVKELERGVSPDLIAVGILMSLRDARMDRSVGQFGN